MREDASNSRPVAQRDDGGGISERGERSGALIKRPAKVVSNRGTVERKQETYIFWVIRLHSGPRRV